MARRYSHLGSQINEERLTTQLIEDIAKGLEDIRRQEEVLDKEVASRLRYLRVRNNANWITDDNIDRSICPDFDLYAAMHNIQNLSDIRRTIHDEHHAHPAFGSHARQAITSQNIDPILCRIISNLVPTTNVCHTFLDDSKAVTENSRLCHLSRRTAREAAEAEAKAVRQAAKTKAIAARAIANTAERAARRIEKEAAEATAKVVKMKAKEEAKVTKWAAKQADMVTANAKRKKETEEAKAAKRTAIEAAATAAKAAKQTVWYERNCARHNAMESISRKDPTKLATIGSLFKIAVSSRDVFGYNP